MLGFGLLIGLMFPFVAVLLGVARDIALRPSFFIATLIAGLVVAEDNHLLARDVVGARLQSLVGGMQHVEASLVDASSSSEWAWYDLAACTVAVDSTDELGDVAASFNRLVAGLSTSHWVSDGVKSLSQVLAAHLELGALAEATLRELSIRTGCDAAGLVVASNGRVEVAGSSGIRDAERLASVETVLTALRTGQPTVLRLPVDVVVSGSLVDFIPQEAPSRLHCPHRRPRGNRVSLPSRRLHSFCDSDGQPGRLAHFGPAVRSRVSGRAIRTESSIRTAVRVAIGWTRPCRAVTGGPSGSHGHSHGKGIPRDVQGQDVMGDDVDSLPGNSVSTSWRAATGNSRRLR